MPYESRVDELLEEILESKRSPEEVCAECPELLSEVRSRLARIRGVEAQVDLLFPTLPNIARESLSPTRASGPEIPGIPGYEIKSVLGRGGMGIVYHARHLPLNRSVALKMLIAGSYATRVELLRFVREAEAVAGLRHANIVQVYDVGEIDGRPYYTMELVDGGSLAQKIARAPLSVRDAAEMLVVLSEAVQSAHDGGIVHRDLKPANIMLATDGTAKISDFGLARRVDVDDGLTMTGARLGTPSYMAPEQLTGGAIGPAVDIYALGGLLYEMLTGKPPFRGDTVSETERRLVFEEPEPPSRVNAKVPRDLETICLKCLEKAPERRYGSAAELAEDLQRFLRFEPIRARPTGRTERALRWVRRNPATAALIVTAAVLCGLLAFEAMEELSLAAAHHAEKTRLTARLESGLELEQQGRYSESRVLLAKLGDGGNADLRQRIDGALADLDLVRELDSVALDRVPFANGRRDTRSNQASADRSYAAIFARSGLGSEKDRPDEMAARVKASDIKTALVAALDDWAACATDLTERNRLLEVVQLADPDPNGWRDRARDPKLWNDQQTLSELANSAPGVATSLLLLRALGDRLDAAGLDSIAFRKRVQQEHPDDFLANISLAEAIRSRDAAEAVRYYQAAVAIRQQATLARNNLGAALAELGRTDEAIDQFRAALGMDPKLAVAHYNLGVAFQALGKNELARESFRRAIEIDPEYAAAPPIEKLLQRSREDAKPEPKP